MSLSIDDLLKTYRDSAETERDKGTYYERLCKAFLLNDPVQAEQYSGAWTWTEWAPQHGLSGKDTGIDLVAKLRDEEGFAAIQCKFYSPKHKIAKTDIDSFLAASSKAPFARRVVMDSTEVEWSGNAETMLEGQTIPVLRIGLGDMRASPIQWSTFAATEEVVLEAKKELRPHQQDALDAVRSGLAENDRGKIIMACGTGKTFTGLKIAEDLVGADGTVLFLVPSLALMAQTVREWSVPSEDARRLLESVRLQTFLRSIDLTVVGRVVCQRRAFATFSAFAARVTALVDGYPMLPRELSGFIYRHRREASQRQLALFPHMGAILKDVRTDSGRRCAHAKATHLRVPDRRTKRGLIDLGFG